MLVLRSILCALFLFTGGTGPCPAAEPAPPVLQISNSFSGGSACPIEPRLALTAAHVVDIQPFNQAAPLADGWWSDPRNPWTVFGPFVSVTRPRPFIWDRDLALLEPAEGSPDFPFYYPLAQTAPKAGDEVVMQAWDWSRRNRILGTYTVRARLTNRAGNDAAFDRDITPGSSGGCAFNARGEVIGIVIRGYPSQDNQEAGVIELVYGQTFSRPAKAVPAVLQ